MTVQDPFSGDLEKDWASLREFWLSEPTLMQAEVGPKWEMPGQHRACIDFARRYPEAKEFLLGKLSDPLPLIAAYAFKCLVRITDLKASDLPETIRTRKESITVRSHSHRHHQSLAEYFSGYFESYEDRDALLEEQKRTLDWQENELARYNESTRRPGTDPPPA